MMEIGEAKRIVKELLGRTVWAGRDDFREGSICMDGDFEEEDLEALLLVMREEKRLVRGTGIEPVAPCMSSKCSTAELTAPLSQICVAKT
jgi:hypothetical protein